MTGIRILAGAALAASLSLPLTTGAALSQTTCQCLVAAPEDGSPIGRILTLEGDVRVSETLDYIPASSGEALMSGRRIIVGNGVADVLLGSDCRIAMPANTSLTLIPAEQGICAALETEALPVTEAATTNGSNSSSLAAAALAAGGVAAVVGVVVSSGGGDDEEGSGVSD